MPEKKRNKSDELSWDDLINPTRQSIQRNLLATYKIALRLIFQQAKAEGRIVMPDEAIVEAERRMLIMAGGESAKETDTYSRFKRLMPQATVFATRRTAHHYAVDLHYSTYNLSKRGAPKLPTDELPEWEEQGMTHREIAQKLGLSFKTPEDQRKSKDVARKRLSAEKKRQGSK